MNNVIVVKRQLMLDKSLTVYLFNCLPVTKPVPIECRPLI